MGTVKYIRVAVKSCRLISSVNTLREKKNKINIDRPGKKRILKGQAIVLKKTNCTHRILMNQFRTSKKSSKIHTQNIKGFLLSMVVLSF